MSDTPISTPEIVKPAVEDNSVAIISYLFGIGLIIAAIMHSSNKTQLGAYHLRQSLGLLLIGVAGVIVFIVLGIGSALLGGIPVVGWALLHGVGTLSWVFRIGMTILWALGIISAYNREQKPLPLFGTTFQRLFAGLFV